MTTSNVLSIDVEDRVATITFGQPPANALTLTMIAAIESALDEAEQADARALVFTSAVPGFFVAGADLKLLGSADADVKLFDGYLNKVTTMTERVAKMPLVSIAAIEGYALGGGLELASACTFRIASSTALLGVPEVKLGLLPGAGGTQRLPHMIGRARALDMILTGRNVAGEEAKAIGLIDRLVDEGDTLAAATQWAETFATGPADAYAAIIRTVDAAIDGPFERGLDVERAEVLELFGSPDGQEGLLAFLEKRPAKFS